MSRHCVPCDPPTAKLRCVLVRQGQRSDARGFDGACTLKCVRSHANHRDTAPPRHDAILRRPDPRVLSGLRDVVSAPKK